MSRNAGNRCCLAEILAGQAVQPTSHFQGRYVDWSGVDLHLSADHVEFRGEISCTVNCLLFFGSIENQGVMQGNFVDCRTPSGLKKSLATDLVMPSQMLLMLINLSNAGRVEPMGWSDAGSGVFVMELVQWVMVDRSSSCVYSIFSIVLILTIFVGLRF